MFKDLGGGRLSVFNGPDEQFVAGRLMGADGGIGGTYAAMPSLFLKADRLLASGNVEKAREVQNDICRIIYAMCECKGNLYAVIKELLRRKGIYCGSVRAPLYPLAQEDLKQVSVCEKMIADAEQKARVL